MLGSPIEIIFFSFLFSYIEIVGGGTIKKKIKNTFENKTTSFFLMVILGFRTGFIHYYDQGLVLLVYVLVSKRT